MNRKRHLAKMPSLLARAQLRPWFCSCNYRKHTAGQDHSWKIKKTLQKKTPQTHKQTQPSYRGDVRGICSAWIRLQSLCIHNYCLLGLPQDFGCSEQAHHRSYSAREIKQHLPAAWNGGQELQPSGRYQICASRTEI